ncbi:MAG TPA: glycosyltransferase family 2 protein [Burkholderiaceae bacterium]|nr:glycosyltransferase family 2 protein [Burkholderiaceae bacterium]
MTMLEIAFVVSAALIAYAFVGYPLLLWVWARVHSRPVRRSPIRPTVAIVIVAHNEAARIAMKIESCLAQDYPAQMLRVLVACDGSTDETATIVESYRTRRVDLLAFPVRRGKAACLNDAIGSCTEEIVVLTDARQQLHAQAVWRLVENLGDPQVGAVSGELVFVTDEITSFGAGVDAYWRYEKFIRRSEAAVHSMVGATGALYALRRELFEPIPPQTLLDDVLIPMNVVLRGRRVVFESGAIAYDRPARDAAQEQVRKVRTLAGNFQLFGMHPRLLSPLRNPIFLQTLSHKVLRLVVPLAMVVLLASNVAMAWRSSLFRPLLALQLVAYGLPTLGLLSRRLRQWRPVGLATAFLLLNWFVVLGFIEFLTNRDAHLWRLRPTAGSAPLQ